MFSRLRFDYDKTALRKFWDEHKAEASHHKTKGSEAPFWLKLFDSPNEGVSASIVRDLGLSDFDVRPRFSYQLPNTRLTAHIDIDRIVGINLNLMPEPATIHMNGKPQEYPGAALIDVGSVTHSVECIPTERLVLKLAVRAPWHVVYSVLESRLETDLSGYVSVLTKPQRVRL